MKLKNSLTIMSTIQIMRIQYPLSKGEPTAKKPYPPMIGKQRKLL